MFWGLLFIILFSLMCTGLVYLGKKIKGVSIIKNLTDKSKAAGIILPAVIVILITSLCVIAFKMFAAIVVLLHLILIWLLCDLISFIIKKLWKKAVKADITAIAAVLLTAIYLGIGWYYAHHIFETAYTIQTDKLDEPLRIVAIADSHLSVTLDGEAFASELERIEALSPDVLFIVGDLVDDDSDKEDMIFACEALGKFEATHGVYYVYGNHDKGYSDSIKFSDEELRKALTDNGVTILEDDVIDIGDKLRIIGRKDRSDDERNTMDMLVENPDDRYTIVLDHQPNDYDAQEKSGVDLVISGHTHGGHIFPAGFVGLLIGANDKVYGHEKRGNTDFIVTSGISGWAIPFKTGCISEYIVIDIE